jgi:hypothetical protein
MVSSAWSPSFAQRGAHLGEGDRRLLVDNVAQRHGLQIPLLLQVGDFDRYLCDLLVQLALLCQQIRSVPLVLLDLSNLLDEGIDLSAETLLLIVRLKLVSYTVVRSKR